MKKISILFIFQIICFVTLFSQTRLLTIDEATIGQYRQFYPQSIYSPEWRPGGENYTFIKKGGLFQSSAKDNSEKEVLTKKEFTTAFEEVKVTDVTGFGAFSWIFPSMLKVERPDGVALFNVDTKKIESYIKIDDSIENQDFSVESKMLAFTKANNLYVADVNSKITAVSNEKNTGIVYGKTVHRNEFGIEKGTFWSPSGKKLAFYRMDESMITQYPLVDIEPRIAELRNLRYPMAGMQSHEVTVGVFSVDNGKIIYLKTGEPKVQYLTSISWSNDEKYIFIAVLNPQQNHMKFNQYDAVTGDYIKTLFEEKNDKYVEPLKPAVFLKKSSGKFIWESQRDGYNHLYLYDINGKLLKQITKGNWAVIEFKGFNDSETELFYVSTEKSPLERNLYSVNIETGKTVCLTTEKGYHSAMLSDSKKYVLDQYSSVEYANIFNINDADGKKVKELLNAPNPLKEISMPEMEMIKIKAADGKTDLYGRVIKPLNFDKTKKYPAILYVYGGPHAQLVENSWLGGAPLWDFYMAQKGYVVITIDNRGSANRGFEFESVIHRNCGEAEALDQMEAVKYLKNLGYVDEKRIGVHGWSYGGFMTINLMTTFPDVFKAGVAGGPVIDWKYYEVMYGERYMDTPQENAEGYQKTSLIHKAKNLKGDLLIIHGYIDDTVVLQNSLAFLQQCIIDGILVDYFLYPEHPHNVRGMDRIHLMKKITKYFDDNL
ncbi:MAG: DPP IV N-terminal domain-containing protein [Bacteroidia bacterium]|nr:DPP IV N-terminal domain-containing protein [Bacteroidia bacterium]